MERIEIYNDHFQNYKTYGIPKAQLVIADIPFNIGKNAYASNPMWYKGGDLKNGESELAAKEFFDTDKDFRVAEFMQFCSRMMKKEPRETGQSPCMIVFCAFEQQMYLIEKAREHGIKRYIPMQFYKNYSAQVLKANMRVVGNTEYALLLYRDKLPKFNNDGKMIFNCLPFQRDDRTPKVHPTMKPVNLLRWLIRTYTNEGDTVLDNCMGSGSTGVAAVMEDRCFIGIEVDDNFFRIAEKRIGDTVSTCGQPTLFSKENFS